MVQKRDFPFFSLADQDYPEPLKQIPNPPERLFYRGTLLPGEKMFTVVGTRKPTGYGVECAKYFVGQLASYGFTIVSGLALGTDAIVHQTALDNKTRTIAVLGSGVDIITPLTNERLGLAIIEQGALVSEFAPGTLPQKFHFPQRDRIMAGLSLGTLVIEAGEKSGALITAHAAAEQGREVFAVPGDIFSFGSKGTHRLIQEGAKLISDIDDILEEISQLNLPLAQKENLTSSNSIFTQENKTILSCLSKPKNLEELIRDTRLDIAKLRSTLTILEIKRIIKRRLDGKYQLNK